MRELYVGASLSAFRHAARRLLAAAVLPQDVHLRTEIEPQLSWLTTPLELGAEEAELRIPKGFAEALELAAGFRSADRWDVLYRLIFRVVSGERHLLELRSDPEVLELARRVRAVNQDLHHATAFLRFSVVTTDEETERSVAWLRTDHLVLPRLAGFFERRFPTMPFSILTPDGTAHWDCTELVFGPGVERDAAPGRDELVDLWRTYYAAAFNPARANPGLLKQKLPSRYMAALAEGSLIPSLLREAPRRTQRLISPEAEHSASAAFLPEARTLDALKTSASGCTACPLHEHATQTVFGEGPVRAKLMLVGEQPGDQEDRRGTPFIGPAGRVLDEALKEVGIDRDRVYLTNAVKHFRHTLGDDGKQRLHQRPGRKEVLACKAWLEAEIAAVQPEVILCLGATAAQAFFGPRFSLGPNRGRFFQTPWARAWMATFHPSAVLRAQDAEGGRRVRESLAADLRLVAERLAGAAG